MKKLLSGLLSTALLFSCVSCVRVEPPKGSSDQTTPQEGSYVTPPITTVPASTTSPKHSPPDLAPEIYYIPGGKRPVSANNGLYEHWLEQVENNRYDAWFKEQEEAGVLSKAELYSQYLAYWRAELAFTVEHARWHFYDDKEYLSNGRTEEEYNRWKSSLEEWEAAALELLDVEREIFGATVGEETMYQQAAALIRQKVLDTKRVIYMLHCSQVDLDHYGVEVDWRYQFEDMQLDVQNGNVSSTTGSEEAFPDFSSYSAYFTEQVENNRYDAWLKEQLNNGAMPTVPLYSQYMVYWRLELAFTVERAEQYFDGGKDDFANAKTEEEYNRWKSSWERWETATVDLVNIEILFVRYTLGRVEVGHMASKLLVQKILDSKYSIYMLAGSQAYDPDLVTVDWRYQFEDVEFKTMY
jgi:hypothetical protein